MVIISKSKKIELSILIRSESRGQERLYVEIDDTQVVLRARSCMTEVCTIQAHQNPQRIANACCALISDVFPTELDLLVREVYKHLM
ncbi:Hypothetical protein KNT65_gp067 [Escherichia phage EcS1]|uniref:Uncharacterized protein n=1 Tax=Escherichia phage EcS1 TaxID=2083276 RepID=A0A2Z5ZCC3_9CAUD|nr:Hypothetical protein KNT65_gp067 [Escherichia phage EcS1]BBC78115.1 Hypothetical protein [Escherichia phage EcS1]